MSTALHYSPVKKFTESGEIFGLGVAIHDLLKAYLRYSQTDAFRFLIEDTKEWDEITATAAEIGCDPKRLIALDRRYVRENFANIKTIVRLDPSPYKLFWQRQTLPAPGFSLCTLAHAISGLEAGDILEQYCLQPTSSTDALICPSRAIQSAIKSFWAQYADYLSQQFGAKYQCPVQLPVIPLGINTERFEKITTADKRAAQRAQLNIPADATALLWVGRLSHAIKAHPLAMFQAAERAAEKTGKPVHLIMVGYFVPASAEAQFKALAADFCKKAQVHFIASNDPRFPDGLWAAGDIFLSLIDNMQESFGLTPIEAMAAGLPRIISDWDGYRDSVTDGEDGFLIRTTQPPPGNGTALAEQLLFNRELYGGYLAKAALTVAVDQNQAADRIAQLITDPNLRQSMAARARTRAQSYDWKNIIPLYEKLWSDLASQRTQQKPIGPSPLPQAPDPYTMYAAFPTAPLAPTTKLSVTATADQIKLLWQHEINIFGLDIMLPPDDATQLINYISANTPTIAATLAHFTLHDKPRLWRSIAWLIKLGIISGS